MMYNSNTDYPLVSAVIPAYNAAAFVERAIDSVLAQTYPNIEIIVINDGSTDNTLKVLERYRLKIILINQPNRGTRHARNQGIRAAQGEWIAYLDADDYWLPEKIERQVNWMQNHPKVGFCSTRTRVESAEGEYLSTWKHPSVKRSTLHTLFETNAAIAGGASGVTVRSDLQGKVGLFDESLASNEDVDMWMRLAYEAEYACLDEILTVVVRRPNSISRNLSPMRSSALRVMKKNRHLLDKKSQKQFWRNAYATVLCDYAKWEARSGQKLQSILHLLEAFSYAPVKKGRLCAGLLLAIITDTPF